MAVNGEGVSLPSEYVKTGSLTLLTAPAPPTDLQFTKTGRHKVELTWLTISDETYHVYLDNNLLSETATVPFTIDGLNKQ